MKEQKKAGPSFITVLFLSWFFSGKSPKAPGTIGSLATLPLILLLHQLQINLLGLLGIIGISYIAAVIITQKVQVTYGLKDPQWIVIDEVIGMLITWSFTMQVNFLSLAISFGLFRLFDIIKIWPASYFDHLNHGIGTITDDVISGIYAGMCALLLHHLLLS
jgi:phosphatidylglycerophosphatase A